MNNVLKPDDIAGAEPLRGMPQGKDDHAEADHQYKRRCLNARVAQLACLPARSSDEPARVVIDDKTSQAILRNANFSTIDARNRLDDMRKSESENPLMCADCPLEKSPTPLNC